MTFYKSVPVVVEALRFDGSGASGVHILGWLAKYGVKKAILFGDDENAPAQLDLLIPHVKIAEIGDYVVRIPEKTKNQFLVMTEEHFKATYRQACGTCTGQRRDTTNMVCLTCGHDYSKGD